VVCTGCGTATATWTWTPATPLADGTYTITFRATDTAGNTATTTTQNLTVDTSGPTLSFSGGPADGAIIATGSPTYTGNATDATTTVASVEVDVNGGGFTT